MVSPEGTGLQVESDLDIRLYATRSAGAGVLAISDVVLLPMDEGLVEVTAPATWASSNVRHIVDNTGYFMHGRSDPVGELVLGAGLDRSVLTEMRGVEITLEPGVINRLYFFGVDREASPAVAFLNAAFDVAINIVPRSSGVIHY